MLQNTFSHVPGIGPKIEQKLWAAGLHTWDDFIESATIPLSPGRVTYIKDQLRQSQIELAKREPKYFTRLLPSGEHWRIFSEFQDSTAYLDIETTNLDLSLIHI